MRARLSGLEIEYYVSLLAARKPFSFARYGDGEWAALLGREGANCDGHRYYPELGERLRQAIIKPLPYFYGLQPRAMRSDGREIAKFLRKHDVNIPWHNADVFHDANIDGALLPFIQQLRSLPVVMVGPPHLKDLPSTLFSFAAYIEVPPKDCFLAVEELKARILETGRGRQGLVFALSASMTANVVIHDLYPALGDTHWLLDLGSLWDIYAGVRSRSMHTRLDWETIIRRNTGAPQSVVADRSRRGDWMET
jgi:hypothetical protein